MQATHTPADPPNRGRIALAMMGSTTNNSAELQPMVTA